jgi:hypothetical protein
MKRWTLVIVGVILAVAGVVWTLQGLNVLGQTGGMNGQGVWAVIGIITAVIGLAVLTVGARTRRPPGRSPSA